MKIFITGTAGYVGGMLANQFSSREDVEKIICLDKEAQPEFLKDNKKILWINGNTSDGKWQDVVRKEEPEVVIHTAWQIREMYGNKKTQWRWNVDGSDAVFDFVFANPFVKKLVYFSTVSSYGAQPTNKMDYLFTEEEPFRDEEYLYAVEKKVVEEHLENKFKETKQKKGTSPQIFVVRPAAITGPRGRFMMKERFGLQSALAGKLSKSFIHRMVTFMVSFVPAPPMWLRQFIHEDDVNDIVSLFTFTDLEGEYEVFNICPPGKSVLAKDMARVVGKKTVPVPPRLIRIAFFFFWHITRGRIPTSRGGWKFYSYPIAVDGAKLTRQYGFNYRCDSHEAFEFTDGRYESFVPEEERKHKVV